MKKMFLEKFATALGNCRFAMVITIPTKCEEVVAQTIRLRDEPF